ncbi:glucose-6-phosphate dehydrogenase [Petroclostridium sp. X23]|uniref:glucose-6-phosphate dehydrogenase n=1 Tax=Petroclostridium sp. X23 TaxID=3045146 RepID=UPI0024ADC5C7|nr:glucose-6-phosphate dehydrogenase [Petroclostridium sp. X23]WHH57214.1 glucose-6-phosphate dehydrogenase [Petroclostridium sp. X23]
MANIQPFTFVIFGGTGDLAARKLIPALYNHFIEKNLEVPFSVVGISRKPMTHRQFGEFFIESVKKYSRNQYDEKLFDKMISSFYYISGDLQQDSTYENLTGILNNIEGEQKNRLFYLATTPEYFPIVLENLTHYRILEKGAENPWHRVIIEKPFGSDLATARMLNKRLERLVNQQQMYRIDHYLGKEAVQNFMVLRFANGIFEPLWNNKHIDHIQITVSETVGVGTRGRYYEHAGAVKDMLQNHIIQLLSLIAMEPPVDFDADSISTEKVKVIRSLRLFNDEAIVRGQYEGYTSEKEVHPQSKVETFIAAKLEIHNWRWAGVPMYVRTGKYLKEKKTEVVIQFKNTPYNLYKNNDIDANRLVISVDPKTGFDLQFNVKEPHGANVKIRGVKMNFCHECEFGDNTPEAYERLLMDGIIGDATLFTSWREIEYSWKLAEEVLRVHAGEQPELYQKGAWGPQKADKLLKSEGRKWYHEDIRRNNANPCGDGCIQK